jgi:hypothetical protein
VSKLSRFVILLVVGGLAWNWAPVKARRTQAWGLLQSGTDAITGKDAADIGQDIKRQQLHNSLSRAVREYRQLNGDEPHDLSDLVTAGLLQNADLSDEWGRPLESERGDQGFVVRGLGRDGERGTADDWTVSR